MFNPYTKDYHIGKSIIKAKDTNSCTVVALSCVTGNSFEDCDVYLRKYGRKYRRGMYTKQIVESFKGLTKFKVVESPYSKDNRITINNFLKKHTKGKFYCLCRGHAFAIIDGVLYDHKESLRRQITEAYRFYNEQDLIELRGETNNEK